VVLKQAALVGEGDRLLEVLPEAEVIAQFVVSRAKAGRCLEGTEATHGVVALFDAAMVLLDTE